MELYLVRHAVAYPHDDPAFPNDDDRPLTPKGRKQFERAAEGLFELIDPPAVVLSSPLPRAAETAQILIDAADDPETCLRLSDALRPGGSFEELLKECSALVTEAGNPDPKTNRVMKQGIALVGHAPSIGLLAAWLLNGESAGFALTLEKGGAACLAFDGLPEPGFGDLRWLVTPKILRRMNK
jgi:phosphohistidine phosphatase